MSATISELADEALRLAESDPARSSALAERVVRAARTQRDFATASVAERALGLAAQHNADLDTAIRHLRTAVALAGRARSVRLAALARMTLAYALVLRGRGGRSLREITTALHDLRGADRARALVQHAAILQHLGRFDEALATYRTALSRLRRHGDELWTWRTLCNRGVLHARRLELSAAEADLREAERLSRRLGLDLSEAHTQENLGWVFALRGEVPVALHYYDLAEQRFRALRSQLGEVLTDRSELLLSVRLPAEAREVAGLAVRELRGQRRLIALPEVRLLLARAAMLDDDPGLALEQARRAAQEFTGQHRPEWAALARFAMLTARAAGEHRSRVPVRQVEAAADRLDDGRWTSAAVDARLLAGQLALERGRHATARQQLRLASRARRRGPATVRARAWHAEALLRLTDGNRRGATAAARTGLRILDEHRATFGATDLRAYAAGHRTELAELGLRMALERGSPAQVLTWAEHGRASRLMLPPARPPDDPVVAATRAELRQTMDELAEAHRSGRGTGRLEARQVALERRIRDRCRQHPGSPQGPALEPVALGRLAAAVDGAVLVEFVQLDDELSAVTVADGRARLHRLGALAPVRDLASRVPFALRRLARAKASEQSRSAALHLLRHSAEGLDAALLRPLAEVGDRPLVVVPTGPLQSLPWSTLPSCAGRPVAVSPSAAQWYASAHRTGTPTGRVAVAAGPRLPGAHAEADAVARIYGTRPLVGPAATVAAVMSAMTEADLLHLATHGEVRASNPLFSSLTCADGPLMVYDLERLERVPATVVLAACDSGSHVVGAGDELLGLGSTFLANGAQELVGSVISIPDSETAPLMLELHRLLRAGRPAAAALALAQQRLAGGDPVELAAAAGFICIGAGLRAPRLARAAAG